MSNFITIIAFRPDSADYCRGCLMDSRGAEFESCVFSSIDEAAKYHARLRFEDTLTERWVADWQFTVCFNGFPILDPENQMQCGDDPARCFDPDEHEAFLAAQKSFDGLSAQYFGVAEAAHKAKLEQLAKDAEAKKQRQARSDAAAAAIRRREQYEKLKREFGD